VKRRLLITLTKFAGGMVFAAGLICLLLFHSFFLVVLLGFVCLSLGAYLLKLARRIGQPSAEEVLAGGAPPVLFLRAFSQDSRPMPRSIWPSSLTGWMTPARQLDSGLEELIAPILSRTRGPVIAVGRPGEGLPPLGAARIYARDAEWQDTVHRFLQIAVLIVLVFQDRASILWELGASGVGDRHRLVIFFPPDVRGRPIQAGWDRARAECPWLPEVTKDTVAVGFATSGVPLPIRVAAGAEGYTDGVLSALVNLADVPLAATRTD
jgi:hypothetical protein